MESIWEILKYVAPALLVWSAFYYTQKKFFKGEESRRIFELKMQNTKISVPIKLRAFERLILFLERTKPENIIPKLQKNGMTSVELHAKVIQTIRSEYEHNLSQQLYVSPNTWLLIKSAKESLVHLFNTSAGDVDPNSPSLDMARGVFDTYHNWYENPVEKAIAALQTEIRDFL